ncbi:MAG: DUF58 domain-containing protein [Clostridia bacterium]|nr:DUF58 domain-containing protein [Clostridia bacterium]
MKHRAGRLFLLSLLLLFFGFSTGSPVFLAPAMIFLCMILYAWLSLFLASRSLSLTLTPSGTRFRRGDTASFSVFCRLKSPLPLSPLRISICTEEGSEVQTRTLTNLPGRGQELILTHPLRHVGVSRPRVTMVHMEDLFSLFSRDLVPKMQTTEILVLPVPFDVDPLHFSQGEEANDMIARATEDNTSPSDIRSYQAGDPMKKIHWKASLRLQDLVIRRFEEPEMPDALILMDCTAPGTEGLAAADLRDSLLETAASVIRCQLPLDHPLRMPLYGSFSVMLDKSMGLERMLEHLARFDFSQRDAFEEILRLEAGRMRKVGSFVIITSRLSGEMVDILISMRRMGPALRLYLCSLHPDAQDIQPFIARLQVAGCEVCYVQPSPTQPQADPDTGKAGDE